jgi:hypothetical protein
MHPGAPRMLLYGQMTKTKQKKCLVVAILCGVMADVLVKGNFPATRKCF